MPGPWGPATNPILRYLAAPDPSADSPRPLRVEQGSFAGATNKAAILVLASAVIAIWTWSRLGASLNDGAISHLLFFVACMLFGASAAGLIFLTVRKKARAPFTAPLFAVFQGLFLGMTAAGIGMRFPGVVIQAVPATAAMSLGMMFAYRSGLLHVTDNFNKKITVAIAGAVLFYAANFVLGRMGEPSFSIWAGQVPGIFALALIAYMAGIVMTADFDAAVKGTKTNLSGSMEWYVALGLVLTLVWFYMDAVDIFDFWEVSPQGPPGGGPGPF